MRGRQVAVFFLLALLLPLSSLQAQNRSTSDILNEVEIRLNRLEFGEITELSHRDLKEIKSIVRLRKQFVKSWASQEGVQLRDVRLRSLYEGMMTFYDYCNHHDKPELAEKIGLATAKLLTVKGLVMTTLNRFRLDSSLFRDVEMKSFFSEAKNIETIYRKGEVDYEAYFALLEKMSSKYNPKKITVENNYYLQAKRQSEDYQRHKDVWLELIYATDIKSGEYTLGLRELIRKGHFGRKEALSYFYKDSAPAKMVRSMIHFYFMRAFSEAYMSVYHWDGDRFGVYVQTVLTDPMMHMGFITFSVAADRARDAFKSSSTFRKLGLKHPLFARSLIDAGPLFTGMIVSDIIFQLVEHPRFGEIWWLSKNGQVIDAFSLFLDLAGEVWFRKSFLARAVVSTAVFTGYNMGLYATLEYGGKALTQQLAKFTTKPFFTKVSFSPVSSFIAFTSAFIMHDIVMEKVNPIFNEWDWQSRLKTAEHILKENLLEFENQDQTTLIEKVKKELSLQTVDTHSIMTAIFNQNLGGLVEDQHKLSSIKEATLHIIEKKLYRIELLKIGREHHKQQVLEEEFDKRAYQFPHTVSLLRHCYKLMVSFEFLNQVYRGYRDFLFMDVYTQLRKVNKAYAREQKNIVDDALVQVEKAQSENNSKLAQILSTKAMRAREDLKAYLLSSVKQEVINILNDIDDSKPKKQAELNFQIVQNVIYNEAAHGLNQKLKLPSGVSPFEWYALYSVQIRFCDEMRSLASLPALKDFIENEMVTHYVLSIFKRFQVNRGKQDGLGGWMTRDLSQTEQNQLLERLQAIDPEKKNAKIRQLLSIKVN